MAIYGIDLGTTNSLIGLNSTGYLSDIVPSCVDLENGKAGAAYFDDMSAKRSFKVDMSMGVEGIMPRAASKYVLKALVEQVKDDVVKDVVISVPAYFNDSQRTATVAAAEDAGLKVHGLVNEPTAAAMFIAQRRKGLFLVYDLGGGTFDVSIIDSRFGTYDVQATSGCTIGGDNFDKTLVKYFVKNAGVPFHKMSGDQRMALQHNCKKYKEQMQKTRAAFDIDFTDIGGQLFRFTPEAYVQLMKMTFAETITCMSKLIKAWIPESEVYDIVLVGGSTHCPYLQDWITEVTGKRPAPLTYDPDRVVAQGAALYAELIENGEIDLQVSDVTKALSIGLYDGTVSNIIPANSKIPTSVDKMFTNPVRASQLVLDLYQGESMFIKDNEHIGKLIWDFETMKEPQEGQVIVNVTVGNTGMITFSANELLKPPKVVVLSRVSGKE